MNVLQSDWELILLLFIIFILKLTQYIIVSFLLSHTFYCPVLSPMIEALEIALERPFVLSAWLSLLTPLEKIEKMKTLTVFFLYNYSKLGMNKPCCLSIKCPLRS